MREKIVQSFYNTKKTINLLSQHNKRLLGLSLTLGLLVSLPLLTIALTSQNYSVKSRAASDEPVTTTTPTPYPITSFQDNFDSIESLNDWRWVGGSAGSGPDVAKIDVVSGQFLLYAPKGIDTLKPRKYTGPNPGKFIKAQLSINGQFSRFPGDFDISVDLNDLVIDKNSAYQQLDFGRIIAIRRIKSVTSQSLELRTTFDFYNSLQDFDKLLSSITLDNSVQIIKVRLVRNADVIYAYYNLGPNEVPIGTLTNFPDVYVDAFVHLTSQNLEPKYPQINAYYDNFSVVGQILPY